MLSKRSLSLKTLGNIALSTAIVMSALGLQCRSAMAFTCDDVRSLSAAQQDYWAKRLSITPAERHKIWAACYRDYHPGLQAQLVRR